MFAFLHLYSNLNSHLFDHHSFFEFVEFRYLSNFRANHLKFLKATKVKMANPIANPTIKKPTALKFAKKSKSSRKLAKKAILNREFKNLKSILPTVNNRPNVDEVSHHLCVLGHLLQKCLLFSLQSQQSKLILFFSADHHPERDRQNDQPSGETSACEASSSEPNQNRSTVEHIDFA